MKRIPDSEIIGKRFGRIKPVQEINPSVHISGRKRTKRRFLCTCDCGKNIIVALESLRSRNTFSCGCYKLELLSQRKIHGKRRSPEYRAWTHLIDRCCNPNDKGYKNYGGRGIKVCDEWRNDFTTFYQDVGDRPSPKHNLDRIDNDGDYCPENCRWATREEQSRNKRTNRIIEWNGKTQSLAAWAEETGLSKHTIQKRLKRRWPISRALTEPVRKTTPQDCSAEGFPSM